ALGGPALPGPLLVRVAGADGAAGDGDGPEQCDGAEETPSGGELSWGGGEHGVLLRPGRPCAARPSQPAWSMSPHRRTAVVVRGCDVAILRPRGLRRRARISARPTHDEGPGPMDRGLAWWAILGS